ncbi:MAG TPA: formate dehydrogenase accessory protein FdhE [Candidatus Acidoferrales bacterium]|jgi:FdhE protein|nr:formate dehydrogenase accessory protein FdhE [Candidatus Acidoferrales bacterium]
MKPSKWDARIRRAEDLASSHPFASEGLRFYSAVAKAQKHLYDRIETACGTEIDARPQGALRGEFDSSMLLPLFPFFLLRIEEDAPAPLSQTARELRAANASRWQDLLFGFWQGAPDAANTNDALHSDDGDALDAAEELIAWTFLQPYAEYLADHTRQYPIHATPSHCPVCGTKPQVGVLRPLGDGAKRSLICALCAHEWDYRRLVCPSCSEENPDKLAVYSTDDFGHVRVEACDSCHSYIKTVDLSKDGRALPVVDELATIPLNLWATEHGYTKLQPNLLGI